MPNYKPCKVTIELLYFGVDIDATNIRREVFTILAEQLSNKDELEEYIKDKERIKIRLEVLP